MEKILLKNLPKMIGCPSIDFLKKFGTLHDLLIGLLNEKINTLKAAKQQNEMIN